MASQKRAINDNPRNEEATSSTSSEEVEVAAPSKNTKKPTEKNSKRSGALTISLDWEADEISDEDESGMSVGKAVADNDDDGGFDF